MNDGESDFINDIESAVGLDDIEEEEEFGYVKIDAQNGDGERIALRIKLDCHCTDLGNATRFVAMHGHDVRYCKQTGRWFIWDGRRWAIDETDDIIQRARQVAEHIDVEANYVQDANFTERIKKKTELIKWAKTSESENKLRAMVSLAESFPEVAVTADTFDRERMLLTCLNGTLDLELFELRPHRRGDFITKLAPVNYDAYATFTQWDSFLSRVLPSEEVRSYVQRAAGYSLTGSTGEEVLFYICGPTASGKSTFIEAMKATLGDYAETADFDAFLKRKVAGGPRNDIARLDGARFVSSIEVDEGKALAEALIKNITGNEKLVARFLHKEFFEFQPQFKLFFAANTVPKVNAKDSAVWRRIHIIPFDVEIPEEDRDIKLKERLRTPELAGSAVLAWAVEGCRQWQEKRLSPPDEVKATTTKYRLSMTVFNRFVGDCCTFKDDAFVTSQELYDEYKEWADTRNLVALDRKQFGQQLSKVGCKSKKKRVVSGEEPVRCWLGIEISRCSRNIDEDGFESGERAEQETFE